MCHVLIVEDHEDTRRAILGLIEDEGHTYGEACNGQEALEWLREQPVLPCVILFDLRMPVMDGWDFVRAIRLEPKWSRVGLVVISATVSPGAPKPVLPANGFFSKPLQQAEIGTLHRYCEQHRDSWIPRTVSS
jgi:CheY-like chemotaxis protein